MVIDADTPMDQKISVNQAVSHSRTSVEMVVGLCHKMGVTTTDKVDHKESADSSNNTMNANSEIIADFPMNANYELIAF